MELVQCHWRVPVELLSIWHMESEWFILQVLHTVQHPRFKVGLVASIAALFLDFK